MNTAGVIAKTAIIVQSRLSRNDMYKVALGLRSIVSKRVADSFLILRISLILFVLILIPTVLQPSCSYA